MNFDSDSKFKKKNLTHGVKGIMPGDVLLIRTIKDNPFMALIGWLIRKITRGWTTHAAIYLGGGGNYIVEALLDGVKKTKLKKYLNNKTQFLVYRNRRLNTFKLTILKDFLYSAIGKPYDLDGIKDFIFDDRKNDANKFFCSELEVIGYQLIGIKSSNKPARKSSPADLRRFYDSPKGKKEGWILWDTFNIEV